MTHWCDAQSRPVPGDLWAARDPLPGRMNPSLYFPRYLAPPSFYHLSLCGLLAYIPACLCRAPTKLECELIQDRAAACFLSPLQRPA